MKRKHINNNDGIYGETKYIQPEANIQKEKLITVLTSQATEVIKNIGNVEIITSL
jgi:hypothetical protein